MLRGEELIEEISVTERQCQLSSFPRIYALFLFLFGVFFCLFDECLSEGLDMYEHTISMNYI